jgi:phosphatidylinositol-3-phosphatase
MAGTPTLGPWPPRIAPLPPGGHPGSHDLSRSVRIALVLTLLSATLALAGSADAGGARNDVVRAALPPGAIQHIVVVELENEDFDDTFGPSSPATYLNSALVPQGQLVPNYFATSHASLGNYISQVSGQASTPTANNDCISLAALPQLVGGFFDVAPGTDADPSFPGQVVGDGCVYPAPTPGSHGARTIGDQLDAEKRKSGGPHVTWRAYAEDMGKSLLRDGGVADALGGSDCAHPPLGGTDPTNVATAGDQFATRHVGFLYFHSVVDDAARCAEHVVPLGTVHVGADGAPDTFSGHLAQDFAKQNTTPAFSFITPNLCNDGHDAHCVGPNTEGGHTGGLIGADLWLKHWMPLILSSPAYRSGKMLVVVTFDEGNPLGGPTGSAACCGERPGPNWSNPGYSAILGLFGFQTPPAPGTFPYPGGGQVGAVLLNRRYIEPGSVDTTGAYNHYSALRSYEDLLGLTVGGDDGYGHLGFAADTGVAPFGPDIFNAFHGSP